MASKALEMRMWGIQKSLMAHYMGGVDMPNASKGDEREVFLREYLQALFPANNRFSKGAIIDSYGGQSGQIDIVVEHPTSPSFPMPGVESNRLMLAESVAAVIEVKSDVSAQWGQACKTIRKVKALRRRYDGASILIGSQPTIEIPCVAVGYKGFSSCEAIQARLASTPAIERPDAVLSIESGAFVGPGIEARGWCGIYALCTLLNDYVRGLVASGSNMLGYVMDVTRIQD